MFNTIVRLFTVLDTPDDAPKPKRRKVDKKEEKRPPKVAADRGQKRPRQDKGEGEGGATKKPKVFFYCLSLDYVNY